MGEYLVGPILEWAVFLLNSSAALAYLLTTGLSGKTLYWLGTAVLMIGILRMR